MAWYPMGTAPRDGRRLLLFTTNPDEPIEIGYFMAGSAGDDADGPDHTWSDSGATPLAWAPLPRRPKWVP